MSLSLGPPGVSNSELSAPRLQQNVSDGSGFSVLALISEEVSAGSLFSGKPDLPVFACLFLQSWGHWFVLVLPCLFNPRRVVDFSVFSAFCLLRWNADFA